MSRTEKLVLPAIFFLLCASAYMHVDAAYIGDKIWLLHASRMWLDGRTLYVDIFEVNPPLIVWLYAVPVWLSLHLPLLKDYQALALTGLGLCGLTAWLGVRLIRMHPAFSDNRNAQIAFAALLLLLFVFYTPTAYFCDREHLFFMLTLPYVLRFMPSLARQTIDWRLRLLIGVLASVGFCTKPYTLLVFAVLQLLFIARERSPAILWSMENTFIYVLSLGYLACIWRFTPEYISVILPMALITYSAFSRRIMEIFYCIVAFTSMGLLFADFRPRLTTAYRRDTYYFLGISAGYLAYALANNGWGYTYHPLFSMVLFLAGWMLWDYSWLKSAHEQQGMDVRPFVFGQRACILVLLGNALYMLYGLVGFYTTPACVWDSDCQKALPYVKYVKEHNIHSFGALSEDFHRWPMLTRLSGARMDTRYNALWMVPKLVSEGKQFTKENQWIVDVTGRGLADDLTRRKPDVVFVDASKLFFGYSFGVDLINFFSGVPEFKAAWSQYRYAATIDQCNDREGRESMLLTGCRYDIYERRANGSY